MENREIKKGKKNGPLWLIVAVLSLLNWLILIAMKGIGAVGISWTSVWLGVVWIPGVTLALATLAGYILAYVAETAVFIRNKRRERKEIHRIREQAKAFGVWDKPQCLGGKALELSAWEHFKIKRGRGESDADLRRRCMMRADIEKFKAKQEGEKANV